MTAYLLNANRYEEDAKEKCKPGGFKCTSALMQIQINTEYLHTSL